MEIEIDYNGVYFDTRLTGTSTLSSATSYFQQLANHPHWRRDSLVLSDQCTLDASQLDKDTLKGIAEMTRKFFDSFAQARFATYTHSDLIYGVNRVFQSELDDDSTTVFRVFHSRQEALDWLLKS